MRRTTARSVLVLFALSLTACEPPAVSPTPVMVIARDANGQYRPQQVQVRSLTRPVTLEGTVARFLGAGRVVQDPEDPALQNVATYEQLADAILKNEGSPVRAHLYNQSGVMWPADYHSWNMATAYYLVERAADYFRDTSSVPESALDQTPIYYFPDVRFNGSQEAERDNAFYVSLLDGLLFVPEKDIETVPLALNRGVMVHEYSHRIFNKLVHRGALMPEALTRWDTVGSTQGINVLQSLNEGLADYHAVSESCRSALEGGYGCDTRFLADTFGEELANERDLALESRQCLSEALWVAVRDENHNDFTGRGAHYQVGTVIATALWQAGQKTGQQHAMEQAVLDAYADPDLNNPGLAELIEASLADQTQFTLGAALDRIVAHVSDPPLRDAVCGELMDQVGLDRSVLPSCYASAQVDGTCQRGPR
ncbi:MAG TPA: hypothetical protein VK013_15815 [Myxococcaceae bacterium]|nr:hypothetical protein [Myxococcaceae bacterium]